MEASQKKIISIVRELPVPYESIITTGTITMWDMIQLIRYYVALYLLSYAYADWKEEYDGGFSPGTEILSVSESLKIPDSAFEAADTLLANLYQQTGSFGLVLFFRDWDAEGTKIAVYYDDAEYDELLDCVKTWCFYTVSEALGHGVAWGDNYKDRSYDVPPIEYSYYDLPPHEYPRHDVGDFEEIVLARAKEAVGTLPMGVNQLDGTHWKTILAGIPEQVIEEIDTGEIERKAFFNG